MNQYIFYIVLVFLEYFSSSFNFSKRIAIILVLVFVLVIKIAVLCSRPYVTEIARALLTTKLLRLCAHCSLSRQRIRMFSSFSSSSTWSRALQGSKVIFLEIDFLAYWLSNKCYSQAIHELFATAAGQARRMSMENWKATRYNSGVNKILNHR